MQNSTDGPNSPEHRPLSEAPSPEAARPSRSFLDRVRQAPAATATVGAAVLTIATVTTAMAGPIQAPPAPAGAAAPPPAAAKPLAAPQHAPGPKQPAVPHQQLAPHHPAPAVPAPVQDDQKRKKIINAAQHEIGTRETGEDCQPYSSQCVSWCALFAMSMWHKAGVDVDPEKYAFTGNVFTTGQEKGTAFDKEHLHDVKPGDVLLFGTGPSTAETSEHIGVVEKVDGDTVTTIEGNSGSNADRVARDQHQLSPSTFYGGVHPW